MSRYTFASILPRLLFMKVRVSDSFCGTLCDRDVAREPTWMYLRRSRKRNLMAAPFEAITSGMGWS